MEARYMIQTGGDLWTRAISLLQPPSWLELVGFAPTPS